MRLSPLLLLVPALSGCVTMQQSKMNSALAPWVGQSIASYAMTKGPPSSTVDLGPGTRLFIWNWQQTVPGIVAPIGGNLIYTAPGVRQCVVRFTATSASAKPTLSDWVISSWNWEGAC